MVSTKPYLLRALYEWCVDQGLTPYMTVQVDSRTCVPSGYARDGQIVLNIGPEATHQLKIDNEQVTFQARFNGIPHNIIVPVSNVAAIAARENGIGMAFQVEPMPEGDANNEMPSGELPPIPPTKPSPSSSPQKLKPPPRGSHLKVIK
ncbi:MAG: ClpXP protease specificity-enhancing factor [Azoarcus sp.]|jgi:stringent starvation protein B|nr:ClpXP protease specificity-enhancing factor [Azoarcus sp.]